MNTTAYIGSFLKQFYRKYSTSLITHLEEKGFSDLRPSFLEILLYLADNEGASLKKVGDFCQLKKQTMTTHVNELVKRGYVVKKVNPEDRREQAIYFTEFGNRFRIALQEISHQIHDEWSVHLGEVELKRLYFILDTSMKKIFTQASS